MIKIFPNFLFISDPLKIHTPHPQMETQNRKWRGRAASWEGRSRMPFAEEKSKGGGEFVETKGGLRKRKGEERWRRREWFVSIGLDSKRTILQKTQNGALHFPLKQLLPRVYAA